MVGAIMPVDHHESGSTCTVAPLHQAALHSYAAPVDGDTSPRVPSARSRHHKHAKKHHHRGSAAAATSNSADRRMATPPPPLNCNSLRQSQRSSARSSTEEIAVLASLSPILRQSSDSTKEVEEDQSLAATLAEDDGSGSHSSVSSSILQYAAAVMAMRHSGSSVSCSSVEEDPCLQYLNYSEEDAVQMYCDEDEENDVSYDQDLLAAQQHHSIAIAMAEDCVAIQQDEQEELIVEISTVFEQLQDDLARTSYSRDHPYLCLEEQRQTVHMEKVSSHVSYCNRMTQQQQLSAHSRIISSKMLVREAQVRYEHRLGDEARTPRHKRTWSQLSVEVDAASVCEGPLALQRRLSCLCLFNPLSTAPPNGDTAETLRDQRIERTEFNLVLLARQASEGGNPLFLEGDHLELSREAHAQQLRPCSSGSCASSTLQDEQAALMYQQDEEERRHHGDEEEEQDDSHNWNLEPMHDDEME